MANFREADAAKIEVGHPAEIRIDALSGETFEGLVIGIAPAAGTEFSLIQPDNDSGNFVKVAQRIAVRIALLPEQEGIGSLRPGMSVEAVVDTSQEADKNAANRMAAQLKGE